MILLTSKTLSKRFRLGLLITGLLVATGLSGIWGWPRLTSAATGLTIVTPEGNPVTAAWEKAKAAGSYHFTSDVTQVTIPLPSLDNVGRSSRSENLHMEGQNDLRAQQMDLTLWSDSGSVSDPASGVGIKIDKGQTFVRQGTGEWQPRADAIGAIAPQGDLLSYLTALRNVTFEGEERRGSAGHAITFRRYSFEIDGPRFAIHMRDQMEATARTSGELPADMRLETPLFYRDMSGTGELWIADDGLPLRQILTLQFPPQHDEQVQAQVVVDFTAFGTPQPSLTQAWQAGNLAAFFDRLSAPLPNLSVVLLVFGAVGCMALMLIYRRKRLLQTVLVTLIIFSQVVGPILSSQTTVRFIDVQSAKAAAQTEEQNDARNQRTLVEALGKNEFNPHLNPLEKSASTVESSPQVALAVPVAAPSSLLVDNGVDTDSDGLSDFAEERAGTIETVSDSDFDGLDDKRELQGFSFDNKNWYLNPTSVDSNGDGIGDATEWGLQDDGTPRTLPLDTDGDKTPDLFDFDNDNDGVPDGKDLAPFAKSAVTYSEGVPLQLTLNHLTQDKPTMVEFQVRPQNEKHLWFAFNVLDWPQDSEAQVQDIDGKTYADIAQAANRLPDANEDGGDMKLLPMLEIRMPISSANLPTDAELFPFNITVNDLTQDGQTKVAYVPLSIVTDERSGQRVGFAGQMRYQPTGSWNDPHEVRLVWTVQALVDVACDPQNQKDLDRGCQADGYIHNNPQVIQSYYDDWTLTGLTVREDHGADLAIIYEDPTVDDNLKDDKAIWSLSYVLDHHFLIARDADNNGQRDLTLETINQRFDHTRNSGVSEDQRFAVPNLLRVETKSYDTLEQAVAFTAMTETQKILTNFITVTTADPDVKPLILFAQEAKARMVGTDLLTASGNYASESGSSLTLDMAPSGQTAQPLSVMAGLKWAGYCGSTTQPLTWRGCSAEEYWATLAQRYENLPSLPDDGSPDWVKGRLQLAQLYYTAFAAGSYRVVQSGTELASFTYSLDGEATTTAQVRAVLGGVSMVPLEATLAFERAFGVVLASSFLRRQGVIQYGIDLYKGLQLAKQKVASAKLGTNQKLIATEVQSLKLKQAGALKFYGSPFATIGAMFSIAAQIASLWPTVPVSDRTILGTLSLVTNLAVNVVLTAAEVGMGIRAGKSSWSKVLSGAEATGKAARIGNGIGLAITIIAIWGFFIYSAVTSGMAAGTPALNKAAIEAVAATIFAVLLFALAFTVVGLIITLIFAVIESLLTLICELGVDELRVLGGACFSFTTTVIKAAGYFIYNSDLMVDLGRDDLVTAGAPTIALLTPTLGFVGGNPLTITLPVTTTLYHKDADIKNGLMIFFYHYLFSSDNLKSSTFHYSLTHPDPYIHAPGRNGMTDQWLDVVEDHKQNGVQPMYRGYAKTDVSVGGIELQPGLNQVAQYYFNMGYAVPIYECFVPLPLFIPVCHADKSQADHQSTNYETLKFDVFPATLDGFMALGVKPDGGVGLQWDARFPSLYDVDGDGLRSFFHGGIDPNDSTADADNDGLTDEYELLRRSAGYAISPILSDSDNDGLSDLREIELGGDPGIADSDNDGLSDSVEHNGWDVTINALTPFVVHVTSDPKLADSDEDGLSDQAERDLALSPVPANRLDNQNRPYHPRVFNTPPIAIFQSTDDVDGILGPNQAFVYTTSVVAYQALAPGVLNITAPSGITGASDPYALPFNSLTFSASQTVTVASNMQVNSLTSGEVVLTSTVNTRLPNTGPSNWTWNALTNEQIGSTSSYPLRDSAIVASRGDLQDNYLFAMQSVTTTTYTDTFGFLPGDLFAYQSPSGVSQQLDQDVDDLHSTNGIFRPAEVNGAFLRGKSNPSMACNNAGQCMVVWDELDYCNTMTINSVKVLSTGDEPSVEPLIFLARDPKDNNPLDGGFEMVWTPPTNLGVGTFTGGNVNSIPFDITFCGPTNLYVSEWDSGDISYVGPDPTQRNWAGMNFLGWNTVSPTNDAYSHRTYNYGGFAGYSFQLDVNIGAPLSGRQRIVAAAMIGPDGTISKPQFQLSPTTISGDAHFNPVVTSDGSNFLVAWENVSLGLSSSSEINTQIYDGAGNAVGALHSGIDRVSMSILSATGTTDTIMQPFADLAAVWADDHYIVTRLFYPHNNVTISSPPNLITSRQIASDGSYVLSSTTTLVDDASIDRLDSQSLAWDPVHHNALLLYRDRFTQISELVFGQNNIGPMAIPGATGTQPQVAYHPASQSWLYSYNVGDRVEFRQYPTNLNASFVIGTRPVWPSSVSTNNLVCPLPSAFPLMELRFEELPGVTTFVDSSGYGNNALCERGCPAAGSVGAPNAPLSDYAVKFNGSDPRLLVNKGMADSFTIALWIKAPSIGNQEAYFIEQGNGTASDWSLGMNNGLLRLRVAGQVLNSASPRIDNDQWHFVAASRDKATGKVALYVDGASVASATLTTNRLTGAAVQYIGGDYLNVRPFTGMIDHLQLFGTSFAADAVQALFNRTGQSYCVAGGIDNATKNKINWTRVNFTKPDTRGGRISASQGMPLIIDSNPPTATLTTLANNSFIPGNATTIIGGDANDPVGSAGVTPAGVGQVEVQINGGAWQTATGSATWFFALTVDTDDVTIRVRATDNAGNLGPESAPITLHPDAAAPQVTLNAPANTLLPTQNEQGQWQVTLSGTASDGAGSGVKPDSVEVLLTQQSGVGPILNWQTAILTGTNWTITYLLPAEFDQVTDAYDIQVRASDKLGNRTADNAASGVVRLDNEAPTAFLTAIAGQNPGTQLVISQTVTLSGVVTDSHSSAGLQKLEIAFTPIEQIAALPEGVTGDAAEALLNRPWLPVTLAQSGAGKASSSWSFQVPAGLENQVQINLRATDMLGNRSVAGNAWRGAIDTLDPRVSMTATATGANYFDAASNQTMNEIRFVCTATDRHLSEESFDCPGNSIQPPVRSFSDDAALQALFPDQTIRSGLANTYTLWLPTTTPSATVSACDVVGHCASASTGGVESGAVQGAGMQAAAPAAPKALIVNPTQGSFVAAASALSATVAAEAGAGLKEVTIKLDNATVQTLSFAQSPSVTRTLLTVNVPVAGEGAHTLVAQATAWDNSTQTTLFPVAFTLDQNVPVVTIDASTLTLTDTWQAGSGILRFNGNASDSVGLAAVQIREGVNDFVDAAFGNGTWQTALPVIDPEGRTLNITVRAIDRAGRITQLNQTIGTQLSAPDAPNTAISSGPSNPSTVIGAQLVFTGSATAASFECQLDNAPYTPCASPASYSDLSKGSHLFRVRAVDSEGHPDLTPAEYNWTINPSQPGATITGKPSNSTSDRSASFSFSGDATVTHFECSLDGAAYVTCSSPQSYNNLGNGEHTFLVRSRNNANVAGAADRYVWTVVNVAPVAQSQSLAAQPNTPLPITLTATDNEPLSYKIVTPPGNGVLIGIPPNVTYLPDQDNRSTDSFTFLASDGLLDSTVATVTVTMESVPLNVLFLPVVSR
ncbi:MAG: LamG-like jellyroll fold domain-containing protein [Caldilineaceae bacterium]